MTLQDLYAGLVKSGYLVAYRAFETSPTPPFICYLFVASRDLMADDSNYQGIGEYHVELYTETKSATAEAAVEHELADLGLCWSKSETYIDTEDLYQILYAVSIVATADESVS